MSHAGSPKTSGFHLGSRFIKQETVVSLQTDPDHVVNVPVKSSELHVFVRSLWVVSLMVLSF